MKNTPKIDMTWPTCGCKIPSPCCHDNAKLKAKGGAAFCTHCNWYLVYDSFSPVATHDAAEKLATHARGCVGNPLVAELAAARTEIAQLKGILENLEARK